MVPWSFQEERHPADTPILDFRHLELSKNKSELFYATKFGVICHSDHRKLIYHPGRPECSDPPTMRFSLACVGTVAAPLCAAARSSSWPLFITLTGLRVSLVCTDELLIL